MRKGVVPGAKFQGFSAVCTNLKNYSIFIVLEKLMALDFAFLDSGTGGLPYMKALLELKSDVSCVYVGDTKNFPYGEKSESQIIQKASECVSRIIERWNPKTIVIACNTISVTALDKLRERFPETPFVGTVPAIKPAALLSKTRKIGLLATNATVNHSYTKRLISDFASDCTIISRGDPELISFIEHRAFSASEEEKEEAVRPAVDFFADAGCDVIVLACTHFLNVAEVFKTVAEGRALIVDSRDGVSRHALEVEKKVLNPEEEDPSGKTAGSEELLKTEPDATTLAGSNREAHKPSLYVTGFTKAGDEEIYRTFCKNNGIEFGGVM